MDANRNTNSYMDTIVNKKTGMVVHKLPLVDKTIIQLTYHTKVFSTLAFVSATPLSIDALANIFVLDSVLYQVNHEQAKIRKICDKKNDKIFLRYMKTRCFQI